MTKQEAAEMVCEYCGLVLGNQTSGLCPERTSRVGPLPHVPRNQPSHPQAPAVTEEAEYQQAICKWCGVSIRLFRNALWILDTETLSSVCPRQPSEIVNGYFRPHEPSQPAAETVCEAGKKLIYSERLDLWFHDDGSPGCIGDMPTPHAPSQPQAPAVGLPPCEPTYEDWQAGWAKYGRLGMGAPVGDFVRRERQLLAALTDLQAAREEIAELNAEREKAAGLMSRVASEVSKNQSIKDKLKNAEAELASLRSQLEQVTNNEAALKKHLDAAYEVVGLSPFSSQPLASMIRKRLADAKLQARKDAEIANAAKAVRKHGSDYENGTHAKLLWELVDRALAAEAKEQG